MRSGIYIYTKIKFLYEILSGASIAFAALLLIIPGFITDSFGFLLLIPFTRKVIIKFFITKGNISVKKEQEYIDGEIINKEKGKDKDEL